MANKLLFNTTKTNTTREVEYLHPNTNQWVSTNPLTDILAGTYSNLKARLAGGNPSVIATYAPSVTVSDPIPSGARAFRLQSLGQSNNVVAAPIDPSTDNDPNNVGYDPKQSFSQGPLSEISPSLLRKHTRVYILNRATQEWEPYEARVNAQGFTGNEVNGNYKYVKGACQFIGLAHWWDLNMPNDYLFLEKAGGIGQAIEYFLPDSGDGINNAYHTIANEVWIPAKEKLPALLDSLGITEVHTLGFVWYQGETEADVTNYENKFFTLRDALHNDGYIVKTEESIDILVDTIIRTTTNPDINKVKRDITAARPNMKNILADRHTVLIDDIHIDAITAYELGYIDYPETLGLATIRDKFIFKGYAETIGNTINLWKNEAGYRHLAGVTNYEPVLITNSLNNKLTYAVHSSHRSKMISQLVNGLQRQDFTEKTLVFVTKQPDTSTTNYLFENGNNSVAPGAPNGPVIVNDVYMAGKIDASNLMVLTLEFLRTDTTDTDGKGICKLYKNNALLDTKPVKLLKVGGNESNSFGIFSPFNDQYAQYAAVVGTYLQAFIAYPEVLSSRRTTIYNELVARYNINGTPVDPGTPPVITDEEPTGPYTPETYSPFETGMYVQNNRLKKAASINTSNATALGNYFLAANTSGRRIFQFIDANADGGQISIHGTYERISSVVADYTIAITLINGQYLLSAVYKGNASGAFTTPATMGNYYALTRIGNTGVVRVEESTDGLNWTTIYTFAVTTKSILYTISTIAVEGAEVQNASTQSMNLLNMPIPNDGLLVLNTPIRSSATRGGYLHIGNTSLDISNGFAVYGTFNIVEYNGANNILVCKGINADANESFLVNLTNSGTVYSRVNTTTGIVSPNNTPPYSLNMDSQILFEAVPGIGVRITINGISSDITPFSGSIVQNNTPILFGATRKSDNTTDFPISGSIKDMGIALRTSLATPSEIADLAEGLLLPGTTNFTTGRRQFKREIYGTDTVDPTNEIIILDGAIN